MNIKILFVYPDFENLGIEYLMAVLKKNGYLVDLYFYNAFDPYFNKIYKINFLENSKKIIQKNPDIVCFSSVTDNYPFQLKMAKTVKQLDPNKLIIFGGIHPTALPYKVLSNDFIDGIVIGEGEISLLNFLRKIKKDKDNRLELPDEQIMGILFKKNKSIIGNYIEGELINMNDLPFPDKEAFYKVEPSFKREYLIMASRGCPYTCSYCINDFYKKLRGKSLIRFRDSKNVIEELIWAKKKFNIKYVHFADDDFGLKIDWLKDFAKDYKKYINLPYLCSINPLTITEEKVKLLKLSNCVDIQMGIQCLDEEICKKILKRPSNNSKIAEAIKIIKKYQIFLQVDHLYGIPEDKIDNHEKALFFYNDHRPNLISLFFLNYYPKTTITEYALSMSIISKEEQNKIEIGDYKPLGLHNKMVNLKEDLGIVFLYNYLPFLPKKLLKICIDKKLYRFIRFKSYFVLFAIPRLLITITDKRYFTGRGYIIKYLKKLFSNLL